MPREYCKRNSPLHDRLSELPYELRLQILMLLPRKESARTSVLSSEWRYVWRFRFPYSTLLRFVKEYTTEAEQDEFVSEISQIMLEYRNKRIETLTLSFKPGKKHKNAMIEWIKQAISCGVEELHIDFSQGIPPRYLFGRPGQQRNRPMIREHLFEHNSVIDLHLCYCRLNSGFKFSAFDSLENLYLHGVNINDVMLQKAAANCKNLHNLELHDCMMLRHIKIVGSGSELRLKYITMFNCWHVLTMELDAPNLKSVHIDGKWPFYYTLGTIPPLMQIYGLPLEDEYIRPMNNPGEIFLPQNRVKVLTLCGTAIQQMFQPPIHLPGQFNSVVVLRLWMERTVQFNIINIYRLFRMCPFPNMQKLFIELPRAYGNLNTQEFLAETQAEFTDIMFERLKMLQMLNFEGCLNHTILLKYFLERAVALEQLHLVLPRSYKIHQHDPFLATMINGILKHERASPNAEIRILYHSHNGFSYHPLHYFQRSNYVVE